MGIPVLIIGASGSGKSTSLRNFEAEDIGIFNVAGKPLPFRKKLPLINTSDYRVIRAILKKSDKRAFVIDDSQYLMAFQLFDKVNEKGYDKFTEMAVNFKELITFIINDLPPEVIVYFLHHTEEQDGSLKAKTIGKMLDEKLTLEGLFSVVLLCKADERGYRFATQSGGISTAKSPMDMFPAEIDNDLKMADTAIREYWELAPLNKTEEK